MIRQHGSFTEEEYEEYLLNTPPEARFDPATIEFLIVEGFPKHEAYGMMFEEYNKQRSKFMSYDDAEKKRLSLRLPTFSAKVTSSLAAKNKVSNHHFLILIIELGLITFQTDYHHEYSVIREGTDKLYDYLTSDENKNLFMQLDKQTINLGSGVGQTTGGSKHFVPSVPEWLYNAVLDTAIYLNMSGSDLCYLCWCIGVQNSLPESMIAPVVGKEIIEILKTFERELNNYSYNMDSILKRMTSNV